MLVADGTPAKIETLAAILKEKGWRITIATIGMRALEVLDRERSTCGRGSGRNAVLRGAL